ncbi:MAG: 4Fe-4S dicluster domain-containing protein [Gammaproteobacteria bacterium]|nr:4Fe-4S dicluster domain-containing protein [Gammaproteobacteria bacterium]
MERRTFIQSLIFSAAALAAASLPYGVARLLAPAYASKYPHHLRPPGAIADDDAFVEACIGCGLCGEVCPPKCIQFDKRQGGNKIYTPFIDPEIKACTLCDKCMSVCPTEALTETAREEIKMGVAQIDILTCYPWVDRGVCGACVTICPLGEKAIKFNFANIYRPEVIKAGCVGCGLCVEVCPHPSLPIAIVGADQGTVMSHRVY